MNNKLLERTIRELYLEHGEEYARERLTKYYHDAVITKTEFAYAFTYLNSLMELKTIKLTNREIDIIKRAVLCMKDKYKFFGSEQQVREHETLLKKMGV